MSRNKKTRKGYSPREKTPKISRKFLEIGAAALLAVSVSVGGFAYFSNRNVDNQIELRSEDKLSLRIDSEKRQEYLLELLEGIEIPYCSGVIYDHDGSKIIEGVKSDLKEYEGPSYSLEKLIQGKKEE